MATDDVNPGWGAIIGAMVAVGIVTGVLLGVLGTYLGLSAGVTGASVGAAIGAVGAILMGRRRAAIAARERGGAGPSEPSHE